MPSADVAERLRTITPSPGDKLGLPGDKCHSDVAAELLQIARRNVLQGDHSRSEAVAKLKREGLDGRRATMADNSRGSITIASTPLRSTLVSEGVASFGITLAGALVAILFPYDPFAQAQLAERLPSSIELRFNELPCLFLGATTFLMLVGRSVECHGLGNPLIAFAHWRLGRKSFFRSLATITTHLLSAFAAVVVARGIFSEELVLLERGLPDFATSTTGGQAALIQGVVSFLLIWILLSLDAIESKKDQHGLPWKRALVMGTMTFAFSFGFRHHVTALANPALPLAFWGATGIRPSLLVFLVAPWLGAWSATQLYQFANTGMAKADEHLQNRTSPAVVEARNKSWR